MNSAKTEKFLSSLKDFQRDTVDYVFARMYEQSPPAMRFLIADEVGLGKTKVAAGIVARAVDWLRANDPKQRIDVVYICSNSSIARQNINRLNVTEKAAHDMPDRITLLPRDVRRLRANNVNFIAFTPGTSLNIARTDGRADERALLYWLLPESWTSNKKGAVSVLTGSKSRDRFRDQVDDLSAFDIDEPLRSAFRAAVMKADPAAGPSLMERFIALADQLGARERLSDEERRQRTKIVGELRAKLAAVCIESLEPDLVILDEFQRFSDLVHGNDDAGQLAKELFQYPNVRVLLLSATPYRMFTTADDADGSHYEDLVRTVEFLQNDKQQTAVFKGALDAYGRELYRLAAGGGHALQASRDQLASMLRRVMVRTERLAVTSDRSGMLKEVVCPAVRLGDRDIDSFLALQAVARELDVPEITEYWKSAPYLMNFMDEYDVKRSFVSAIERGDVTPPMLDYLRAETGVVLSREDVSAYRQLDPANARLRNLIHDMLEGDAWRLLWLPPSSPYYAPAGEFATHNAPSLTKRLIFSSWLVVPKVVAAIVSYEAERRMLGIAAEGEPGSQGAEARKKRRGLLLFSESEGRVTGMPVLGLLYPSFVLAGALDPRQWTTGGSLLKPDEVLSHARAACSALLSEIVAGAPSEGVVDERWYWAAPLLLDLRSDDKAARDWLFQGNLTTTWRGAQQTEIATEEAGEEPDTDAWAAHVRAARDLVRDPSTLGRPPADLADVVALIGIAGPAVLALRALARVTGGLDRLKDGTLRGHAGTVGEGLRSLFNQPEVTAMIRRANGAEPYWQRVLEYAFRGNLQSVLDEYAHVLVEHLGVSGRPVRQIERSVSEAIRDALTLRAATVAADSVEVNDQEMSVRLAEKIRFRTRFAVRYGGKSQEENQAVKRAGDVQKAFNSPFWPFVLCSTSVGQEGLDFHLYCHAVMHWNLPSNPVDLEQREGRVHRYKGHAVRKNVAREHGRSVKYVTSGRNCDPWVQMFDAARVNRSSEVSDLVPFWVYKIDEGAQIERHLPLIPLSRDVDRADALRRSLAVYRMAFGQSRQDDVVRYLQRYLSREQIDAATPELRIDLTPDVSPQRHNSGAVQLPGDLIADESDVTADHRSTIALHDLERLLDDFSKVAPARRKWSVHELAKLLDDFAAIRTN